jgi:hypothetical protein
LEFDGKFRLVSENGGKTVTDFGGFALINDFCATKNYGVFFSNIKANGMKYMMKKKKNPARPCHDGWPSGRYIRRTSPGKLTQRGHIHHSGGWLYRVICNLSMPTNLVIFSWMPYVRIKLVAAKQRRDEVSLEEYRPTS